MKFISWLMTVVSEPDVSSESNEEYFPPVDVSESEGYLEVNSKESDIDSASSDDNSDIDEEFAAKSGRVWRSFMAHH